MKEVDDAAAAAAAGRRRAHSLPKSFDMFVGVN